MAKETIYNISRQDTFGVYDHVFYLNEKTLERFLNIIKEPSTINYSLLQNGKYKLCKNATN